MFWYWTLRIICTLAVFIIGVIVGAVFGSKLDCEGCAKNEWKRCRTCRLREGVNYEE